jgi:Sigma-70, region 4
VAVQIAEHKLIDSLRRARVDSSARQRLGPEPVTLEDADLERVEELASLGDDGYVERLLRDLPPDQRDAVHARVLDERSYAEIAGELHCSEAERAPSAYMLSVLGALRHPSTPADRLPAPFYRPDHRLLPIGLARQVYIRFIRRARVVNGTSYYIVPAAQVGPIAPPASVLNRCYAEEIQALKNRLRNVSASRPARGSGPPRAWSISNGGSGGGGGGGGASPQTIEEQGSLGGDGSTVYGIVPLGVATVTLEWTARPAVTPPWSTTCSW